jgi:hypothetical protein
MEEIEIDYVPLAVLTEDDRIQSDAKVAVCLNLQREIDSITNELNQVKFEEENVYEQTSELHSPQK